MTAILGKLIVGIIGEKIKDKIIGEEPVDEPEGKGLMQSKTAWGVTILSGILVSRFDFSAMDAQEIATLIAGLVASAAAIYGRWTARKPIG